MTQEEELEFLRSEVKRLELLQSQLDSVNETNKHRIEELEKRLKGFNTLQLSKCLREIGQNHADEKSGMICEYSAFVLDLLNKLIFPNNTPKFDFIPFSQIEASTREKTLSQERDRYRLFSLDE